MASVRQKLWPTVSEFSLTFDEYRNRRWSSPRGGNAKEGTSSEHDLVAIIPRATVDSAANVTDCADDPAYDFDLLQLTVCIERNEPTIGRPEWKGRVVGALERANIKACERSNPQVAAIGARGN